MKVYDKKGNEYEVVHQVDYREWIEAGYLEEKPKRKAPPKKEPTKPEKE